MPYDEVDRATDLPSVIDDMAALYDAGYDLDDVGREMGVADAAELNGVSESEMANAAIQTAEDGNVY